MRVRFCGPAMTRSMASSRVWSSMNFLLVRAVSSAASLRTLARSAPVKPGVRRATASRSTSGAIGLPCEWTWRIRLRPEHVRGVDGDLAVEAAGTQQGRVEDVGAVGRGDEDDVGLDVEAVHLDEQLVQRLLALVVTAAEAGATVPADGVDLVDEDDGRRVGLGLLEEVAHAGRTDTDEHLDEVGTGDRVERHARLTGDGAREQGLAGTGLAVEQHALGDLGADREELGRLLEELLDLVELLDRLVAPGDVGEGDLRGVLGRELGAGLAELHDPGAAALHLAHEEPEQAEHDDDRDEADQHRAEPVGLVDLVGVAVRRHVGVERRDDVRAAGVT